MKPSKENTTKNKKETKFKFSWKKEYFFTFVQILVLLFLLALIVIILINISNHLKPKDINYVKDLVSAIKDIVATLKDVFVVSLPVFILYFDNIKQEKVFRNNENIKKIEIDSENKNNFEKEKKQVLIEYLKNVETLLTYNTENNMQAFINSHYKFIAYFNEVDYYLLANNIYEDIKNDIDLNKEYSNQTKFQCEQNIGKIMSKLRESTKN